MTALRRSPLAGQSGAFLLAFGLALPLVAFSGRFAPLGRVSTFEVGNDFVAFLGLSFAAIQILAHRRHAVLRAAWGWAALGTLMIAIEDHLEPLLAPAAPKLIEACVSGVFWIVAASLIVMCGRRYAMRRRVMVVMRSGLAIALAAVGLNLVLHAAGLAEGHHALAKLEDFAELAATATLVAGLLLTQLSPLKNYRFSPEEVGLKARSLFYDFGLETKRRYPAPQPILALPGFRHLLVLAVIARFWSVSAGAVSRAYGRGYGEQLLDLLRLGFVHGVDAKSYYVHELYRPEPGLFAATMTRVETKNGLNKRIQMLRETSAGPRDMNDKLEFFRVCDAHGVPSAQIIATVEDGALAWMGPRTAFDRDLFVKDRKGRGGRFTLNFERIGPFLYRADDGAIVNFDEVVLSLQNASVGRRLIVQPKLRNHGEIRSFADKSLVVFRVMTCLDARGEPQATHGVMRLLRRFEPDWPITPDADWGCAIDVDTGEFGLMTGDAPETCTRWFADHPVTGERITGRRLEGWREIADVAIAAHRMFSARVLVGWDIGWTPDGPVILEGNSNADFSYFQRVYRTPVGQSPLGPLLNAHLSAIAAQLIGESSTP
ncbi:sugar-transfer associated ATP-grasp domain-containing protein [Methylopila sp. M107]|uniref:sugar-transfer associated ATP-grasp domain-containing protein n=1 Tax=Methylopila sp. M107 TaxID=1101190 RepID=UPI00036C97A2|nr:sugar-transfer associated ATP-grasp domain-containing protein [Methylopila sp. M107]